MRQPEQKLWDAMKRNAPSHLWLQRVENLHVVGMPDIYAVNQLTGGSFWIENKIIARPVIPTSRPRWSHKPQQEQINWHRRAAESGVRSFFLIRDEGYQLYCVPGQLADSLSLWSMDELALRFRRNSWHDVFKEMMRED